MTNYSELAGARFYKDQSPLAKADRGVFVPEAVRQQEAGIVFQGMGEYGQDDISSVAAMRMPRKTPGAGKTSKAPKMKGPGSFMNTVGGAIVGSSEIAVDTGISALALAFLFGSLDNLPIILDSFNFVASGYQWAAAYAFTKSAIKFGLKIGGTDKKIGAWWNRTLDEAPFGKRAGMALVELFTNGPFRLLFHLPRYFGFNAQKGNS